MRSFRVTLRCYYVREEVVAITGHGHIALTSITGTTGISHSATSHTLGGSPHVDHRAATHVGGVTSDVNFVPGTRNHTLTINHGRAVTVLVARPLSRLFSSPACTVFVDNVARGLDRSSCLPMLLRTSASFRHRHIRRRLRQHSFSTIVSVSPCTGGCLLRRVCGLHVPYMVLNRVRSHSCRNVFSDICSSSACKTRVTTRTVRSTKHQRPVSVLKPHSGPTSPSQLANCQHMYNSRLPSSEMLFAK